MKQKAELLSPCGNYDCVIAAVNAGADAVYLGGQLFNARAYASNFDDETLERVCELCSTFGVKVYVTVNTLYRDEEFPELLPFIDRLYAMGVSGLIMQDPGAIRAVRRYWPDLNVHASTQLTANSLADVLEMEALGIRTAVLSRELNLKEIREIAEHTDVRIETFIHGALCVSYSGQCLMSSVLGNRSGNRGKCAQNCRLNYELLDNGKVCASGHLLSTKDLCTLSLLPELLECGVASLKIEGRMKSPEYVAGVTGIYRKYLDLYYSGAAYRVDPEDVRVLRQLFNRGSFSTGYLKTHSGADMMCPVHPRAWGIRAGTVRDYDPKSRRALIRFDREMVPGDGIEIRTDLEEGIGCYIEQPCAAGQQLSLKIEGPVRKNQEVWQTHDKRLADSLKKTYGTVTRKTAIRASLSLHSGEPARMTAVWNGFSASASGETPTEAKSQPLTVRTVTEQVAKLGNSSYTLEHLDAEMQDGLFLNRSALNALKNTAVENLKENVIRSSKREPKKITADPLTAGPDPAGKSLSVLVRTAGQFRAAAVCRSVSRICMEMNRELTGSLPDLIRTAREHGKKIFVQLPRIWRGYVQQNCAEWLESCRSSEIDGWLVSCLGHLHTVKDSGKETALDFTGNVLNSRSIEFWKERGISSFAVSPEMSREEINALADRSAAEVLAYGYLPLMVTHQCPAGNFAGGKKDRMHCSRYGQSKGFSLRSGKDSFHLDTDCVNCICTITTDTPLDIREDIERFSVPLIRLNFSDENAGTAERILRDYEKLLATKKPAQAIPQNIYDKSVL